MDKILILISIMLLSCYSTEQAKFLHNSIIDPSDMETNSLKAGENVLPNSAEEEHQMLLETREVEAATKSKIMYKTRHPRSAIDNQIHEEFDARKGWPQCKTIGEVHDDGNTRWGWAYATAGVLADRMCIATNGSYNQLLSTEELIFCGGIKTKQSGAVRGDDVWEYLKSHGLVSGGKYNTNDGCQPSKIPPIGNIPTHLYNHTCEERCYGNNTIHYYHDHVKVSHYYNIKSNEDIQKEVQTYGPVSVKFRVYDDFFLYKSGVYVKTEKSLYVRRHFAKLIGWGVENGVDYWLLVNFWGNEWGQNGLFKIKRGTNEVHVEDYVYAGEPEIK
ncbi:cathepsin B-like cysteine proteinase 5 precursor [Acyrthosiphon pisum]|uniref:ACYPI001175 protein n=1 Tax=Acyrthosiphon pisum TaxID=7029 RepID=C4WV02_ACYPI|nr:cathepsin B-like cysteine proteinase 5 precursor [Acyrthosiphon pisum]BAH71722.1 ACYPI001175 [Acyrthosiphon pisum]|eukprot:NP_001280337.1 uncharacterized protein LOC100159833 precursor [Acyrthosiphon pisum]